MNNNALCSSFEERSDEAIQEFKDFDILGMLRFARNGGVLHIYSMFLLNKATPLHTVVTGLCCCIRG